MSQSALSRLYVDDWMMLVLDWTKIALLWSVVSLSALYVLVIARRTSGRRFYGKVVSIIVGGILAAMVHCGVTFKSTLVRNMLESENNDTAEYAYEHLFRTDLTRSLVLAKNGKLRANLRFYAACRAADLLVSYKQDAQDAYLRSVQSAPPIWPSFFSTNGITCGYFAPGQIEGPYSVGYIMRKRMETVKEVGKRLPDGNH